jgi:uncharacterized protein YjbI with pentapeptide repeats
LPWWFWLAGGSLALIVIAAAVWLLVPVWIADRLSFQKTSDRLTAEDNYRKALAQIFGFPLALLGGLGLAVAVVQALTAYQKAQEVAYQAQYQRGFDALASPSSATRIGGLYVLQGLLDQIAADPPVSTTPQSDPAWTLLRAIAAFAVEQPAEHGGLVRLDALTALQILAFRKVLNDRRFELRTGKFPGSVLAYGGMHLYADFRQFDLFRTDLSGSDLYSARMYEANLRLGNFNGANLAGADLSHAGLSDTTFAPGHNFAVPAMVKASAVATIMVGATFYSATGERTRFDGAKLCAAHFDNASFVAPVFIHARLRGTHFDGARLDRPDFSGADLTNASFEGATIINPNFNGAVLNGTNLDAQGLAEADLEGAHLCKVVGPKGVRLPDVCDPAAMIAATDPAKPNVCELSEPNLPDTTAGPT